MTIASTVEAGKMSDHSTLIDALATHCWAVTSHFLPPEAVAALANEAQQLWAAGQFQPAGVGRGAGYAVRPDIRGDSIYWLDEHNPTPAQARYWEAIEVLRSELNRALFLSLVGFEAHYAVYPPGAFYQKHVDRFASSDERMISCILYLNPNWSADQGGQLRVYLADSTVDVLPCAGTFVLFRSDTIAHEVLPATQPRFSLTGWFRRRALYVQLG